MAATLHPKSLLCPGPVQIAPSDPQTEGTLRVCLHPLVDSLNPVGGISITCLEPRFVLVSG